MSDEPVDEGGDPACWLDRVCPECGAFIEGDAADHRCGGSAASGSTPPSR